MFRRYAVFAIASLTLVAPAAAQDSTVAGRPALSTSSTSDLIAQREKWGSKPAIAKTAKGEPPPPEKGVKSAGSYAVLPAGDLGKLLAEREKWGKGPAGYEKKKVLAPRAAGTGKKSLKRVKAEQKGTVKKVKKTKKKKADN